MISENLRYRKFYIKDVELGFDNKQTISVGDFENDLFERKCVRNYPSFGEKLFSPFKRDAVWYTPFSFEFDKITLVNLSDQSSDALGSFCGEDFWPLDIYVPAYRMIHPAGHNPEEGIYYSEKDSIFDMNEDQESLFLGDKFSLSDWRFHEVAFVAGKRENDDAIRVKLLDLSDLNNIKDVECGNLALPPSQSLKSSINIYDYDGKYKSIHFSIATPKEFHYYLGEVKDV
jgi:hypothetical protein